MELTNEFRVEVPVDHAWRTLTDVETIAPCLPGAQLQEVEGDEYRGIVKVKVGPITAQYKGSARFVEQDEAAHRAVLEASGRDTRGQGNASATITALLVPEGDGTKVTVNTDLHVTGRVAQFGRGVLADVSSKLLDQFVDQLHDTVLRAEEHPPPPHFELELEAGPRPAPALEEGEPAPLPAVRRIDHPEAEAIDLMGTAGAPVLKRLLPIAVVVVLLLLVLGWRRRRRG